MEANGRLRTEDRGLRTEDSRGSGKLKIIRTLVSLVLSPRSAVRCLLTISTISFLTSCATTASRKSAIDFAVDAASARCGCRIGIAARHLESGRSYDRDADQPFEAASVIKIAIATEALEQAREGKLDLTERWTLTAQDKADGSGTLLMLDPGLNPTWNDLLTLMLGTSDNTAANAWIRRLGIEGINARMESLGFHQIRLLSTIPPYQPGGGESPRWGGLRLGTVTPRETAEWMARVAGKALLDATSSEQLFEYLDNSPSRSRIARHFSSENLWAGKSGTMAGVRNDAGILRTKKGRFVLVILTAGPKSPAASGADHPAVLAIGDVARAIVETWSRDLPNIVDKPK